MDFDDTPEEAAFRAEARAWLEANAIPKGHPDDFSAGMWSTDYTEEVYVKRCREWQGVLAGGGWAGITWPAEYGGRGGRSIEGAIFNQEQARFGVSNGVFAIAIGMVGPTLLAHGTEEQKRRYLPPMLRGDEVWCQLFSEPEAGSDLAAIATRPSSTATSGWSPARRCGRRRPTGPSGGSSSPAPIPTCPSTRASPTSSSTWPAPASTSARCGR